MSTMNTSEITTLLNKMLSEMSVLKTEIKSLKGEVSATKGEIIELKGEVNSLASKYDLINNVAPESTGGLTAAPSGRRPTKPSFFKQLFLEDQAKYIDVLYTQDEIDAMYANEEVVKKKKDAEKATKVAGLLYRAHIVANTPVGRLSAFESIYTQAHPAT